MLNWVPWRGGPPTNWGINRHLWLRRLICLRPLSVATKEGAARKGVTPATSTKDELWELKTYLMPGDAVLFKGSRGSMETLVEKVIAHHEGGENENPWFVGLAGTTA